MQGTGLMVGSRFSASIGVLNRRSTEALLVSAYARECSIAEHRSYAMMCMLGTDGPDGVGRQSAELSDAARGLIGVSLIPASFEDACLAASPSCVVFLR
jgi:hypothetical protein